MWLSNSMRRYVLFPHFSSPHFFSKEIARDIKEK
jgi:hypothetical protein